MKLDSAETKYKIMAYIDGLLDFEEKKSFEEDLARYPEILDYILELKKDRLILEELELKKTPDYLSRQVLSAKTKHTDKQSFKWGEVVLRLKDKCFELVKNNFTPAEPRKELFSYRDSAFQTEKVTYHHEEFELSLVALSGERVTVLITFPENTELSSHVDLFRRTDTGLRLAASFQPTAQTVEFQDLEGGVYVLRVKKQDLILDILDD